MAEVRAAGVPCRLQKLAWGHQVSSADLYIGFLHMYIYICIHIHLCTLVCLCVRAGCQIWFLIWFPDRNQLRKQARIVLIACIRCQGIRSLCNGKSQGFSMCSLCIRAPHIYRYLFLSFLFYIQSSSWSIIPMPILILQTTKTNTSTTNPYCKILF